MEPLTRLPQAAPPSWRVFPLSNMTLSGLLLVVPGCVAHADELAFVVSVTASSETVGCC